MTINKQMKTTMSLAALTSLALSVSAHAAIVYQDTFDGDGLATNTGIGGGAVTNYTSDSNVWTDAGTLFSNRGGGNSRSGVTSINSFDLTGGFTLEVTYSISNLAGAADNRVNIGLIDNNYSDSGTRDIVGYNSGDRGIGYVPTVSRGVQGLNLYDTALTQLSNAQGSSTGTHTFVLTMDAASNWSFSIDGATATAGTIGGPGFDFAADYEFYAFQQSDDSVLNIEAVTLTVVPEPSTTALLGLGGLALILRRRK